ncbi:MAG: hypothetical protein AAFO03_26005 [Bacteroidota bacterium]
MRTVGFIFMCLPSFGFAQMSFEDIRAQVIVLQNSLVNEAYVEEQIRLKAEEFYSGPADGGRLASQLALLHLKIENYDSAYFYMDTTAQLKGHYDIMGLKPAIKIFEHDRFSMLLDSSINRKVWENNLGIRVARNTAFVREWHKINLLGVCVNDLNQILSQDIIQAKEVRDLSQEFKNYKLRRSKEMIEEFGLPTYSEHGYDATNTFYVNLLNWAPETLLAYAEELEQLAIKSELNGQLVANFIDQKLIHSGKKQRYGTVSVYLKSYDRHVPYPVEDVENIDIRRAQLGLEYTLEQLYHLKNTEIWRF